MNPNNPDFNLFNNAFNDPQSLRQVLLHMQQNPNFVNQFLQNPNLQPTQQPQTNFDSGFASFTQDGFQHILSQAPQETGFVSATQMEHDVVPETQDNQKRKKKTKKTKATGAVPEAVGPSSGPMAPKSWTHDQETALGRCFMDLSEDKTKGNSQKRDNLWKNVTLCWHQMLGLDVGYRTHHQLYSKWKDMQTKLTRWTDIYSNCLNNRKSGMNDEGVLKWAEREYQLKSNGQTFNHYHVWIAVKESPKFRALCQETNEIPSSSKRTKNSETNEYSPGGSDAHTNYAVNLEEDDEEDDIEIREPVRPVGRDTTKRASSSSRQTVSSLPTSADLAHQLEEFTNFQKQRHEEKKKLHEEKTIRSDYKLIGNIPKDELDEEERGILRKLKSKILDKYR